MMQTNYDYKQIPLDDEGFAISFPLDEEENIKRFFDEYGIVVIRDVIQDDQIERTIDEIWNTDYLLNRPGLVRNDPSTFENDNKWPAEMDLAKGGFLSHYTDVDLAQSWENRQNPKVYKAFTLLLNRSDLWVKFDRYGMMRPTRNIKFLDGTIQDKPEWETQPQWLHWDLNPWTEGNSTKVQGLVALSESTCTTGGFHCVPGFHKIIEQWASQHEKKRGTLVHVPKTDPARNHIQQIYLRRGSLLIWDSRICHGNYPNQSNIFRIVQYITFFPCKEHDEHESEQRSDLFYVRTAKSERTVNLTELGEKIAGVRRFCDNQLAKNSFQ